MNGVVTTETEAQLHDARADLQECYALLLTIAHDTRPLCGGYKEKSTELLVQHGVIKRDT